MGMRSLVRRRTALRAGMLAGAVLCLGVAAGCGSDSSDESAAAGGGSSKPLRVGTAASPPWVLFDTGKNTYFGPTVTLFDAIGKQLGRKVEYVNTSYATAIASLQTDKFDVIGLPLYPTPEREKAIDFIN
jgi:ABC-type amino acid transport substrate-binding protein